MDEQPRVPGLLRRLQDDPDCDELLHRIAEWVQREQDTDEEQ
jgi:hypothetical protein